LANGLDYIVLAREVPIQCTGTKIRLAADIVHGRLMKTLLSETRESRAKYLFATCIEMLLGYFRCHESEPTFSIKNERPFFIIEALSLSTRCVSDPLSRSSSVKHGKVSADR